MEAQVSIVFLGSEEDFGQ